MPNISEFIQCDGRNYTGGRSGCGVSTIVVHYTGTDASAYNNLVYFSHSDAQASAHYFIDRDGTLCQSVLEEDTAWHAGNWDVNCRSIGIEVVSAGEDFTEAQVCALAELVGDLRARYGIGAGSVIRHYDVTGKYCPAPYVDAGKWAWLHGRICSGEGGCSGGWDGGSASGGVAGDVADLAARVIAGEFGNGDARRAAFGSRYDEVQAEVNRLLMGGSGGGAPSDGSAGSDVEDLAQRVLAGEFGNGDARRAALGDLYDAVQARVNELCGCGGGGGSTGGGADVDALAEAVIRGDYGNGEERRAALGGTYDVVQARVNEMLG